MMCWRVRSATNAPLAQLEHTWQLKHLRIPTQASGLDETGSLGRLEELPVGIASSTAIHDRWPGALPCDRAQTLISAAIFGLVRKIHFDRSCRQLGHTHLSGGDLLQSRQTDRPALPVVNNMAEDHSTVAMTNCESAGPGSLGP